jgi:hypothetical protein
VRCWAPQERTASWPSAQASRVNFNYHDAPIRTSVRLDGSTLALLASNHAPLHLTPCAFLKKTCAVCAHALRLALCAPAPRASYSHTRPATRRVRPAPRAAHPARVSHSAPPAPGQLASIGRQQVDEHMLQPYVSCVSDVCCICFIYML